MQVNPPEYLYKFNSLRVMYNENVEEVGGRVRKNGFHVLEENLIHGQIYYSDPNTFNDPFELEGVRPRLSAKERDALLASTEGLVLIKGKWVEVDKDELEKVLAQWRDVEAQARAGGDSTRPKLCCGMVVVGAEYSG